MVKTYKELAIIILMPAGISRQNQKKIMVVVKQLRK